MSSRQGGKLKPLKAPKKDQRRVVDDEDRQFQEKQKAEQDALKAARDKASKRGPLSGGGIKKSGKK